jgi:hypothetical protein
MWSTGVRRDQTEPERSLLASLKEARWNWYVLNYAVVVCGTGGYGAVIVRFLNVAHW